VRINGIKANCCSSKTKEGGEMKKKVVWLVVSCLMVAALVLASCAPAVTEEEVVEEAAVGPEVPKYGGTFNTVLNTTTLGFDDAYTVGWSAHALQLTSDELLTGDWSRGPAGTNEFWPRDVHFPEFAVGNLAESWEVPDPDTIIYHIRKGVHWHDKPPVNGREVVAEDVAFSITRTFEIEGSYVSQTNPEWFKSATVTDKYTVTVKCTDSEISRTALAFEYVSEFIVIVPPEVIEKYGDMRDWKNIVGTGPFILVDYVPASSLTFEKNPNYWGKDPLHPENQLPYIDGINLMVIQDASTRLAALRTAQTDWLTAITLDESKSVKETTPELQWKSRLNENPWVLFMRTDTKPFDDIRVRRALSMAIDRETIVRDYYEGEAHAFCWPVAPYPEYSPMDAFTPIEELPVAVREAYEYHPEKAKQLLAEAGYPDGFKTKILSPNIPTYVDHLSLVKEYFEAIGVDMEIDQREWGVFSSIMNSNQHEEMVYSYTGGASLPHKCLEIKAGGTFNHSIVNEPYLNERFEGIWAHENMADQAKRGRLTKEMALYTIEQVYGILFPAGKYYRAWWPWVQNYHGEYSVGYINQYNFPKYIWLDPELKKEMGY